MNRELRKLVEELPRVECCFGEEDTGSDAVQLSAVLALLSALPAVAGEQKATEMRCKSEIWYTDGGMRCTLPRLHNEAHHYEKFGTWANAIPPAPVESEENLVEKLREEAKTFDANKSMRELYEGFASQLELCLPKRDARVRQKALEEAAQCAESDDEAHRSIHIAERIRALKEQP
jgi:hypothetical protein